MVLFFLISLFSLSIFASSYEADQANMSYERLQKIAPTLSELYLKKGKFPGFISAVARKGKVVHYETIGFADVETGEILKKDSLLVCFQNHAILIHLSSL